MVDERANRSYTPIEGGEHVGTGALELVRGSLLAGRYEIRRLVGRGGAGLVVQARDRALDEDVAVKLLRPELGADVRWIDRLAREVKLARQIRHPNVCRVFDFGQADGHSFLVMELAHGSLRDELAPPGLGAHRAVEARLADARAVAEGLAAVHAAGIVHRDVTPQNVLRMRDGRLVVSDFGLATDAGAMTSSLHGGTVAYLAPEIGRGGSASFASDVWALGTTIHEVMFGRRPRWREGPRGPMLNDPPRELDAVERRVLEVCRGCTREVGRLRPSASEVGRLLRALEQGRSPRLGARLSRRRPLMLAALAIASVGVTGAAMLGLRRDAERAKSSALAVDLRGEPADLEQGTRVLASLDGRVDTITARPGGQTVRVVWGDPRRAEDVTLATGARVPAPLPPMPERAGPPVASPDGRALAYEGYSEGRPFVFLGPAAGAAAVPVAAAADPSLASEPRWLAGGRAFVFDADVRNVGVFSLDTNRVTILPALDARSYFTVFKAAVHDRVLVARITDDLASHVAIYSWPSMSVAARFDLPAFTDEWQSADGNRLFGVVSDSRGGSELVEIDAAARTGRRLGHVPEHALRALTLVGRSLVFASYQYGGDLWLDDGGEGRVVTRDLHAREVTRGGGRVLVTVRRGGLETIVELDEAGRIRGTLTAGPADEAPSILPGGRAWTYLRRAGEAPGYYRCAFGGGCERILDRMMPYATVSPDGARVAYIDPAPQGARALVVPLAGGTPREVGDAGSYCRPVWSSEHTLWISGRAQGAPLWVEMDVDGEAARPTGRTRRGARDCTDGLPDPAAPVSEGAKIVVTWRSQVRAYPLP